VVCRRECAYLGAYRFYGWKQGETLLAAACPFSNHPSVSLRIYATWEPYALNQAIPVVRLGGHKEEISANFSAD